ncbi:hypothetical protein RP20_CCG012538 [Aedes albopictus]|nr:hypothetical protein RP20_CCG012538 [Aedes albopictus]
MSSILVLTDLLLFITSAIAISIQVHLDRFEQQKGFHLVNNTGYRVRKYNRTTSVLDGAGDFLYDLGDEYLFTLTVAYSRLGNNQFNQYPMKVSKTKMCDLLNGAYKDIQHIIKDYSNFPQVGNERLCPLPRGHYWVKNWAPDGSWIPSVVPAGYWRFTYDVMDLKDNVVIRHVVYGHIIKGFY